MSENENMGFSELCPYIAAWGLPSVRERREKRLASSFAELRAFHDAMLPRLVEIIEFLNRFPVDDIPEQYRPLSYAALAMCEVDDPVSKWHSVTLEDALDTRCFTIKANFYDTATNDGE